jgi:hypothetical protein
MATRSSFGERPPLKGRGGVATAPRARSALQNLRKVAQRSARPFGMARDDGAKGLRTGGATRLLTAAFVAPHLPLPGSARFSPCRGPLIDARRCLIAESNMQIRGCPECAYRIFALVQRAHAFDFDSDRVLQRCANGARRARASSLAQHAVGSLSGIQLDGLQQVLPRSMISYSCLRGHEYRILAYVPGSTIRRGRDYRGQSR